MNQCKCGKCGSFAINPTHHGRDPNADLDLCDVCYWRKRATRPVERLVDELITAVYCHDEARIAAARAALTGKGE